MITSGLYVGIRIYIFKERTIKVLKWTSNKMDMIKPKDDTKNIY